MAWQPLPDSAAIAKDVTVRVSYKAFCVGNMTETERRQYFDGSGFEPIYFNDFAVTASIEGTVTRAMSAAELRALVNRVFDDMRANWFYACTHAFATDVEVQVSGGIPSVPATTAVSLASVAVLALVGILVYRNYIAR